MVLLCDRLSAISRHGLTVDKRAGSEPSYGVLQVSLEIRPTIRLLMFCRLLRDGVKIQELLEKEKLRLKHLRSKWNTNKHDAENALSRYGPVSCSQLCAKMFERFPREFRDTVYEHLLPEKPIAIARDPSCNPAYDDAPESWIGLSAHLADPNHVTRAFTRELVEKHYRTSTFELPASFFALEHVGVKNEWSVGFTPVDYIMNISVPVQCQHFLFPGLVVPNTTNWVQAGTGGWDHQGTQKPVDVLSGNLEALFGFRAGTKIIVRLVVHPDWFPSHRDKAEWECDTVVPVLLPTLRRLVLAGAKVKVCLEDEGCVLAVSYSGYTFEEIKEQFVKVRTSQ
jgi:hypothetical protein